jgi:hypothetical protein
MHIIKQLSEDEFVIKMDDYDLDKHDSVRIAHDYVQFSPCGKPTEDCDQQYPSDFINDR